MPNPRAKGDATAALGSMMVDLFGGFEPSAPRVPPAEFRVFCAGKNSSDQGDFFFDEKSADSVMAEWSRQGRDLVIDYEHQSVEKPRVRAPAAGWFTPQVRGGELWATNVRWTSQGRMDLETGSYRFFSPTFDYELKTGRITVLRNAGLTNNPSLYGLPALVAASSRPNEEETDMNELEQAKARIAELERLMAAKDHDLAQLRGETATAQLSATVGLSQGAKLPEITTAVTGLVSLRSKVLELTQQPSEAGALGRIETWKGEAARAATLLQEKEQLVTAQCSSEIKGILDGAVAAGKVPPAKREAYETKALSFSGGKATAEGVAWLKGFVEDLPVLTTGAPAAGGQATGPGGTVPPKPPGGSGTAVLSQKGIELAKQSGADPEKVAAWVAKEVAEGRLQ